MSQAGSLPPNGYLPRLSPAHLSGPNESFLLFAAAAREVGGGPGPASENEAENISLVFGVSTGIPAPAQDLACRRCSINIP